MKKRFSLVFLAWLVVCLLGALPFYFSGFFPNFTDAIFESVSGFTTTGATVLADIEALPSWLLFWRALTQWLGGIGILALAAVMLPGIKADISKRIDASARIILLLYAALTALQFILLVICKMNWFDALTHSLSTMSTGGFSVRNNGIAYYNSPAVEWVCAVFMFLAGINFSLIWLIFIGKAGSVMRNSEAKVYAGITVVAAVIFTFLILPQDSSFAAALRQALFHVSSLISTTGFYAADYGLWLPAAQGVLFFLLFIGGCSGSAAGGIKVIRHVILAKQTRIEMRRIIHPRGIFVIQLDGRGVDKKVVHSAAGFVFLYFLVIFLTALLIISCGMDIFTSLNIALIFQGNIGVVGIEGLGFSNLFLDFPGYAKWGLCLVMILGRFEFWTVLVMWKQRGGNL